MLESLIVSLLNELSAYYNVSPPVVKIVSPDVLDGEVMGTTTGIYSTETGVIFILLPRILSWTKLEVLSPGHTMRTVRHEFCHYLIHTKGSGSPMPCIPCFTPYTAPSRAVEEEMAKRFESKPPETEQIAKIQNMITEMVKSI